MEQSPQMEQNPQMEQSPQIVPKKTFNLEIWCKMYYYCRYNQIDNIQYYIETEHGDIDMSKDDCPTLLATASYFNYVEIIKYLVDKGANPNCIFHDNILYTPLMLACKHKNFEILKYLVEKGKADVNYHSPLTYICNNHSCESDNYYIIDMIKYLISKGADINVINSDGKDLLYQLLEYNRPNLQIVEVLVSSGINIRFYNEGSFKGLIDEYEYESVYCSNDILKYLIENSKNSRDIDYKLYKYVCKNRGPDVFYTLFNFIIKKYGYEDFKEAIDNTEIFFKQNSLYSDYYEHDTRGYIEQIKLKYIIETFIPKIIRASIQHDT